LEVNVRERIVKPINEVFAVLVDPAKMSNYFISGSSGPIKAGATLECAFADVGAKVSVDVIEVDENRRIVFEWRACGPKTRVTIQLTADDPNITVATVKEAKFPLDVDGAGVVDFLGGTQKVPLLQISSIQNRLEFQKIRRQEQLPDHQRGMHSCGWRARLGGTQRCDAEA